MWLLWISTFPSDCCVLNSKNNLTPPPTKKKKKKYNDTMAKMKCVCTGHSRAGALPHHHHSLLQRSHGVPAHVRHHQPGVVLRCAGLVSTTTTDLCVWRQGDVLCLCVDLLCVKSIRWKSGTFFHCCCKLAIKNMSWFHCIYCIRLSKEVSKII